MELGELTREVLALFEVPDVADLGMALMECAVSENEEKMDAFCNLVGDDLSRDWLQMIYQYYSADRKEKKQDYTPKCLAQFLSLLAGESDVTVDLCAGSGALTIQRWADAPDNAFELYEIDENVIPFLLFNLAIRNISGHVVLGDVLSAEQRKAWTVRKGERYGAIRVDQQSTL
jgi:hypothetical protein